MGDSRGMSLKLTAWWGLLIDGRLPPVPQLAVVLLARWSTAAGMGSVALDNHGAGTGHVVARQTATGPAVVPATSPW